MTKRQAEALDNAKRVLKLAEDTAQYAISERLIEIADRYLAIADRSKS